MDWFTCVGTSWRREAIPAWIFLKAVEKEARDQAAPLELPNQCS
jgi:hypothetical protein